MDGFLHVDKFWDLGYNVGMKEKITAFERATRYLGVRRRTVFEMRQYLVSKGYSLVEVKEAVDKLLEYGYLNDGEFAEQYVDAYRARGGINKLRVGLYKAGADKDAIDNALENLGDQTDEAEELARRYLRGKEIGEDKKERFELKVKLSRHLAGKGFKWDTVKRVCDKVMDCGDEE